MTTTRRDEIDAAIARRHPGRTLADVVLEHRSAGKGWRPTAEAVSAASGIAVSYETVRGWFADAFVLVPRTPTDRAPDG